MKFTATDLFPARSVRDLVALEHQRIAGRIKQARNESGLTQQAMADLLGVIQRTYQNYESENQPRIPWDRMGDIARITGKRVEWLLHGDTPNLMESMNGSTAEVLQRLASLEDKVDRLVNLLETAAPQLTATPAGPTGQDEALNETQAAAGRLASTEDEGGPAPAQRATRRQARKPKRA